MDGTFDRLAKQLGSAAPRREVVQGLGALALGSLGLAGLGGVASAKSCRKRCKNHCNAHKSNRKCRNKCQRQCS